MSPTDQPAGFPIERPTEPPIGPRLRRGLSSLEAAELRAVRDDDAQQLIALVAAAFDEYPGCVLDLPGQDADLVTPATTAAQHGVTLWVVTAGQQLVASVGAGPRSQDRSVELKRLYVAATHRRRGLAAGLVELVERHAARVGASTVELWSDTRFTGAHRLYELLGYQATGRTRELHDPSETTEFHYQRGLVDG